MALKLKDKAQLNAFILGQSKVIEKALIYRLEYLVMQLQNHAKENAGYKDQTANLKSSIGGVVVKDGKAISYKGFVKESVSIGLEGGSGTGTGMSFINTLLGQISNGYGIIVVAGMEYASYVENHHNLNVLKKTELIMPTKMTEAMNRLKASISGTAKWKK